MHVYMFKSNICKCYQIQNQNTLLFPAIRYLLKCPKYITNTFFHTFSLINVANGYSIIGSLSMLSVLFSVCSDPGYMVNASAFISAIHIIILLSLVHIKECGPEAYVLHLRAYLLLAHMAVEW